MRDMRCTRAMSSNAGSIARTPSRRVTATIAVLFTATATIAAVSFRPIHR